jgi:hypothetical protein
MRTGYLLVSLVASGCAGSVELVLKAPMVDRCNAAGLKGCPELADGAMMYLTDRDKTAARDKILRAAAMNAPGELRTYATALSGLKSLPGADDYAGPLFEVANLLAWQADRNQASGGAPGMPAPSAPGAPAWGPPWAPLGGASTAAPSPPIAPPPVTAVAVDFRHALTADTDPSRVDGGTAVFQAANAKIPCADATAGAAGLCVKIVDGPFILTDLRVSTGCGRDMFVTVGSGLSGAGPRWSLSSPAGAPLTVHGSRLMAQVGEVALVGALQESGKTAKTGGHCALTWSGFKPYALPDR